MATILPFMCIRPEAAAASKVAALPYDVYNRKEAKEEVEKEPLSFLAIDRAEVNFDDSVEDSDPRVYQKAKQLLDQRIEDGIFFTDSVAGYYIYELTMEGRIQTGIVACASVDDYLENRIKKHENTREVKEQDRIRHVDICNAQTGPIFLTYRYDENLYSRMERIKETTPLYDFTAPDGVRHRVFKTSEKSDMEAIYHSFLNMENIYIADGHHRAASAVKVALSRREKHEGLRADAPSQSFLSVLFPDTDLCILPYHRFIKDLNHHSVTEFLALLVPFFEVEILGSTPYQPTVKATFGMYLNKTWYKLTARIEKMSVSDCVLALDVSILQTYILSPLLDIKDARTDPCIDFIGGIRGLNELITRVDHTENGENAVAFSLYPTSMGDLFSVADQTRLMPPKSTWFEPKLRSGLFIHPIEE